MRAGVKNKRRLFYARLRRWALLVLGVGMAAVASLRWIEPPTSSILLQVNLFAQPPLQNEPQTAQSSAWLAFDWQPWENISPYMGMAIIAAEDQRFARHYGLDFVELYKSLRERKNRRRGASTITQQVAKNLFLWKQRSYVRKILEAGLAVYIDLVWGKRRVLEMYMNIVQFGPQIYGVENASRHFFGKRAAHLNRHEAARLAAVLPDPNRRSAAAADAQVVQRQQWILRQMRRLGDIALLDQL